LPQKRDRHTQAAYNAAPNTIAHTLYGVLAAVHGRCQSTSDPCLIFGDQDGHEKVHWTAE